MKPDLSKLVTRLADRARPRTEAMVQSDIHRLLRDAPLGLDEDTAIVLESPVEGHRRIDVEVGFTVIEVKKDLRPGRILSEAITQLAGYVKTRAAAVDQRYVGVLTDGADWRAYCLRESALEEFAGTSISSARPDVDSLLVWLEGILATTQGIKPSPGEISQRLGVASTSHALDWASLAGLYRANRNLPSVELKRHLWGRLLTTALGTQFEDSDELFIDHTLLVCTAHVIAHAVVGFPVASLPPASLLGGQLFQQARISGVVESDFFDWVLEVEEGDAFVRALARRLARFDWRDVQHDVLKVLYESVIGTETRKKLGEYYTPDWLAEQMVATTVTEPLNQRVLDPACGSGTFLFHSVRRYLEAAECAGIPLSDSLVDLTNRVLGVDLHPVAVALARVTYLLAIGTQRITDESRGPIAIPVYLGDSVQWQQRIDLYTADHLVVPVNDQAGLFVTELRFPDKLLDDAANFDRLVSELANRASERKRGAPIPSLSAVFRRLGTPRDFQPGIVATFEVMCRLHDEGRDHIWGYYVRNLARPLWLSRGTNRVDILLGNPPWLAYRHMPGDMQEIFRKMCETRGLWFGAKVATQQDLAGLFVARSIQLYLKTGGRFAFVMPCATLDRQQYAGFRDGNYADVKEPVEVAFDTPWDLRRLRPHFFPRAASVVFGRRVKVQNQEVLPLGSSAERWEGRLPVGNPSWEAAAPHIRRAAGALEVADDDAAVSPYHKRFSNGAVLCPRVLCMVEIQPLGPLGRATGETAVRSARSANEKNPWKNLPPLEGVVEIQFILGALLGECVLPFHITSPRPCVIPWDGNTLLSGDGSRIDFYPRLAEWWRKAERAWVQYRSSDRLSLVEQLDYRRKLTEQLPAALNRVVYGKSGMHIAAARLSNPDVVIDHTLYWAAASCEEEAHYLCAILNCPTVTELVRPHMPFGKDERHVDKYVWKLAIPTFDPKSAIHRQLAELGRAAEMELASLDLGANQHFAARRRGVRDQLAKSRTGRQISDLVGVLLRKTS